jgi:predicted XRE-type DNA-binding protein
MTEEHWPTLEEIEAQDKGRINEARVAEHRERMRSAQRAHRLAEIRKAQGLTQTDVAEAMHVSQRRVSAVERGDLARTELGTVASYVQALGGRVEIVANFGDEHLVIGLSKESEQCLHARNGRGTASRCVITRGPTCGACFSASGRRRRSSASNTAMTRTWPISKPSGRAVMSARTASKPWVKTTRRRRSYCSTSKNWRRRTRTCESKWNTRSRGLASAPNLDHS